jgi:hypothetical protein
MTENLEIIFNNVLEKAYELKYRNQNKNQKKNKFDGLAFWQPIKKMLEPLDEYSAEKWKKISKKLTDSIMLLPEYIINGYEEKSLLENNHFIIQQVRIPLKETPTIRKIVQVALNIGQHRGSGGEIIFNSIDDFITKKDIIELSKYIPDELVRIILDYLGSF